MVERGDLLGGENGVVLRQDQDAGGELDFGCCRRDEGHPDQGIGQRHVVPAAGHLAAGIVGIGRCIAGRDDGVLDRP
jgi:hypothetical protein